jgi:hypothetical protein
MHDRFVLVNLVISGYLLFQVLVALGIPQW